MSQKNEQKIGRKEAALLLDDIYSKAIQGIPKVSKPIDEVANDYLLKNGTPSKAAKSLINYQIAKCGTSGFLSGLGGLITLPVAIPANIGSVLYVQLRMIAAIASLGGYDVSTDQVQTMAYICLSGSAASDLLKQTGIKIGTSMTKAAISKIPGKVLVSINQKVGFRLITKFGEKGAINLVKLVPGVGGVIGASVDIVATKIIADNAYRLFIKKQAIEKKSRGRNQKIHKLEPNEVNYTIEELPNVIGFYSHTKGPWRCFSNFYPCEFTVDGITYNCSEQYMMRQKALCFNRDDLAEKIMAEKDPYKMKSYCRSKSLPEFDAEIWNPKKYELVKVGVKAKFEQNYDLKEVLKKTGDAILCEAAPRDTIWGVGMGENNPLIQDPKNWKGDNLMGEMLMDIRKELSE